MESESSGELFEFLKALFVLILQPVLVAVMYRKWKREKAEAEKHKDD